MKRFLSQCTQKTARMKEILDEETTLSEKDTRENELLKAFVGKNQAYFLDKWENKEKVVQGYNIAAFFFAFFWLLYRKMYLEVLIAVLVIVVWEFFDSYVLEPIMSYDVYMAYARVSSILTGVILGMLGNYLYLKSAQRKINNIEAQGYSESELFEKVEKAGGTSILSVIIVLISVGAIVFFLIESGFLD